jgi:hypothetical protein
VCTHTERLEGRRRPVAAMRGHGELQGPLERERRCNMRWTRRCTGATHARAMLRRKGDVEMRRNRSYTGDALARGGRGDAQEPLTHGRRCGTGQTRRCAGTAHARATLRRGADAEMRRNRSRTGDAAVQGDVEMRRNRPYTGDALARGGRGDAQEPPTHGRRCGTGQTRRCAGTAHARATLRRRADAEMRRNRSRTGDAAPRGRRGDAQEPLTHGRRCGTGQTRRCAGTAHTRATLCDGGGRRRTKNGVAQAPPIWGDAAALTDTGKHGAERAVTSSSR